MSFKTTPETRFDSFDIHTTSYKQIGTHKIQVGILIPKNIKPGIHPVIVKWHGGALATGTALYKPWFATFFPPFIQRNSAIVVLPNYRLIPEHNGHDILSDIFTFWKWFGAHLAPFVASRQPDITLAFDRVLVSGESAGGLMAVHSALMSPKGIVKILLLQYPMTSYLRREAGDELIGVLTPGPEVVDRYLAEIMPDQVADSFVPPSRLDLSYALASHGRWREFFGYAKGLLPIEAVESATHFPPTYIIHGEHDTAVSVGDSKAFKAKVGEVLGKKVEDTIRLEIHDGDHGFDVDLTEEDTPWLKEGLKWVEDQWVG